MLYDYFALRTAFLKEASDRGYDAPFFDGFMKEAEDVYVGWSNLLNSHPDFQTPEFRKQAMVEIWERLRVLNPGEKQADGEGAGSFGPEMLSMLSGLGDQVGGLFGQEGGAGLGGALAGGGGGMVLGLLLSQLFDIPMPLGLLLGALGGGALGYGAAGTTGGQKNIFGVKPPPAGAQAPANPAAAAATASNAAASTQIADPAKPPAPMPQQQPQPQPAPVQPPPAPTPQAPPLGQPPGGPAGAVQPPAAVQPPRPPQPK